MPLDALLRLTCAIRREGDGPIGLGTGFCVAPHIVLTAAHVLVPASASARYVLSFPGVGDRVAGQKDVEIWPKFLTLAATSSKRKNVDAALISLSRDIPGFERLWTEIQPSALANLGVAVFGAFESPQNGIVAKVTQDRLVCYTANTTGGFSGGPVVRLSAARDQGQAVAVHSGRGSHIVNGREGVFAECVAIDRVVAAAIAAQAWPAG